jgi:hypothetical protein
MVLIVMAMPLGDGIPEIHIVTSQQQPIKKEINT